MIRVKYWPAVRLALLLGGLSAAFVNKRAEAGSCVRCSGISCFGDYNYGAGACYISGGTCTEIGPGSCHT